MTGEATDYDPRNGSAATVSRPRDPNVEGPGGYFNGVPGRARNYDLSRPRDRNLPLQFLALRDVGRAGRRQDLRAVRLARVHPRAFGDLVDDLLVLAQRKADDVHRVGRNCLTVARLAASWPVANMSSI